MLLILNEIPASTSRVGAFVRLSLSLYVFGYMESMVAESIP